MTQFHSSRNLAVSQSRSLTISQSCRITSQCCSQGDPISQFSQSSNLAVLQSRSLAISQSCKITSQRCSQGDQFHSSRNVAVSQDRMHLCSQGDPSLQFSQSHKVAEQHFSLVDPITQFSQSRSITRSHASLFTRRPKFAVLAGSQSITVH